MNIVLIGFMGTGKSALGKALAQRLGYSFLDTDTLIEEQAGQIISQIFAEHGEAYFRQLEAEVAVQLAATDRQVIATGGGFVLNPANISILRTCSVIIALTAPVEVIYERVRHDSHRPLLAGENPLEKIAQMLQDRTSFYQTADVTLDTSSAVPEELAEIVIEKLMSRGYLNGRNSF